MMKKVSVGVLTGVFLILILSARAFAADVTLVLSAKSGYKGDHINISGTYNPNEWITVKALDADGNIVFIKPVRAGGDGTYDTIFTVPNVAAGTLKVISGSGSDVTSADFTVKKKTSHPSRPTSNPSPSPTPTLLPAYTPTPAATLSPQSTLTPGLGTTPQPTVSSTPAHIENPEPSSSPNPVPTAIPGKIANRDDKTGTVTVEIDVSALPEGTRSIQMPDGAVVEIGDEDTVEITVSQDDLDDNGMVELVLLDDEGLPLASVGLTVGDTITAPGGEDRGGRPVFIWLLIGIVGIGGAGATVYLLWRKGQRAS